MEFFCCCCYKRNLYTGGEKNNRNEPIYSMNMFDLFWHSLLIRIRFKIKHFVGIFFLFVAIVGADAATICTVSSLR